MRLINIVFLVLAVLFPQYGLAAFDSADFNEGGGDKGLNVTRVTPSGEDVPVGQQIVFSFNRPVVPIGRMERDSAEVHVDISPALECQWRWLNTSSLACQLDDANKFQKATSYTIVMHPGIQAEDGGKISEAYTHTFVTERPKVEHAWFHEWTSPVTPVIRVTFNQAVSKSSVAAHIVFKHYEKNRDAVLHDVYVESDPDSRENPRYISVPGEGYVLDFAESVSESDDVPLRVQGEEARRVWLVYPKRELPPDTFIQLRVTPGIMSASGTQLSDDNKTIDTFYTFPEFAFLGVVCSTDYDGSRSELFIPARGDDNKKCDPLGSVALAFSVPVANSQVKDNVLIHPDLASGRTDYDPWDNSRDYNYLGRAHNRDYRYMVRLPELLQAAQAYTIQSRQEEQSLFYRAKSWFAGERLPHLGTLERIRLWLAQEGLGDLRDEFGRRLASPIDLTFFTGHRSPAFKILSDRVVLEKQIDSDVPIYVTNLDSVTFHYDRLTQDGFDLGETLDIDAPKAQDVRYAIPMQARKMLGNKSGAIYTTITTEPDTYYWQGSLFAIISPYQLHVKIGHYNTLVWVTDLATGEPVADARVQIHEGIIKYLDGSVDVLDTTNTDSSGLALLKGTNEMDPQLDHSRWCGNDSCLFVRVDKGDDMAIMPLEYDFAVSTYRASNDTVWEYNRNKHGHIHAWGTTAQGVYRAGGTIQYKFYVRDQDNESYIAAPREKYKLEIVDPTGKSVHEIKDLALSEFGSYSGEYKIPDNAAVGWYKFALSADFTDYTWQPMRVLVSDFTPAPFKVVNSLNGDLFHPGDTVEVSSSARLHSGGAYTDAESRITATLRATRFLPEHPVAGGFVFASYKKEAIKKVYQKLGNVGAKGEAEHSFKLAMEDIVFGRLTVESSVRDDRGKYIAASSSADYVSVDRLVGLKNTEWVYEAGDPAKIEYIVVDGRGTPVAGTDVSLKIEHLQSKSARVKSAGNAYVNKYVDEWVEVGGCKGKSSNAPGVCAFTPKKPGTYKVTASIKDSAGNAHESEITSWVAGRGQVVWNIPDDNSLQIIPKNTEYAVGDTASYLIKNPYPGAKALVSVERYGVLKSWVQELEGSTPVIEFAVEKDFIPGFYLSIVVTSPRVQSPPPKTGQVDLGKPAFKVGYVRVPVNDPYKQMDISVTTEQQVYKPRDVVIASINAQPRHKDKEEQIEIAVAVLDDAVLDLIQGGKSYFDPNAGFYKLGELDLRNYNLLTQLIGRQKFAKKGANPGGDGGANISMRSLFKYVSYWNPSIIPDAQGNASIDFTLPDNLTGWRILAFATTPTDRMGLGDGGFKVNLPTEIRPVMPNQVTEGDSFAAGFSVMNRTDKPRDIKVSIAASGNIKPTEQLTASIHLEPYKRQTVYIPIAATKLDQDRNRKAGSINFIAKAMDAIDGDGITHTVPIHKYRSLLTAASYGTTIKDSVSESLKFPQQIYTDVGDVSVVLSPSVIGNVEGAFRYIRDYPYICWEQKLTKGVMASHYQNLKDYMPDDFIWAESGSLPKQILQTAANHQSANGGMTYFVAQDKYVSPYLSAYTALAFNWLRASGEEIPITVEQKLHKYLQGFLRNNSGPSFYTNGMSSTVRAVALSAMAEHGKVSLQDLHRYRNHVEHMSLFGKAHYMQAALHVDGAEDIARELADIILAHSVQSGGKFSFNEQLDDGYTRILATPLRANCGILSAMSKYGEDATGAKLVGDVPFKLVRSITQTRGNRDHWENTQENMFCLNSLIDYSRIYENIKPDMRVSVSMDEESMGETEFSDLRDDAVTISRPIKQGDPGSKRTVTISREGDGRVYYATRMSYAPTDENAQRINAGIDIRKEYSVEREDKWILLDDPNEIKRGELVRVDIYVSVPTARNFVVVDDPVPGGLEPVNRDLATSSTVDADKGDFAAAGGAWWFQFADWHYYNVSRWNFYHQELRHDAVRFYSDYLPAGNYHLSYTAQAIAEGEFSKIPAHAEEMYDPDVFGKSLPGKLKVSK